MKGKYIVINYKGMLGEYVPTPILFPDHVSHKCMAEALATKDDVIAAGFVGINAYDDGELGVCCSGESSSLGVKSRLDKDQALIEAQLREKLCNF